jgi:hypothetical protein
MQYDRLFYEEIRDKKKGFSGVHGKTGKRGHVGKLFTMDDMLKGKEKRKYRGTTKVRRFNLYDKILPREEFETLSDDQQKTAILKWREQQPVKNIYRELGMSSQTFYNRMDKLGIPKGTRGKGRIKKNPVNQTVNVVNQIPPAVAPAPAPVNSPDPVGLTIKWNGNNEPKTVEEITDKFLKLAEFLKDEKSKYFVDIVIREK